MSSKSSKSSFGSGVAVLLLEAALQISGYTNLTLAILLGVIAIGLFLYAGINYFREEKENKDPHDLRSLSNAQMRGRAIGYAAELRGFETTHHSERRRMSDRQHALRTVQLMSAPDDDQRKAILAALWGSEQQEAQELDNQHQASFFKEYHAQLVAICDEIVRRLKKARIEPELNGKKYPTVLKTGLLAGIAPIREAADYIEALARLLP